MKLILHCGIATLLFALLPSYPVRGASLPGFAVVPYYVYENRYVVRCSLNGKPLNLMIDSGASISIIDENAFNVAIPKSEQVTPKGIPTKLTANGKQLQVLLAKNLRIGSAALGDGPVALADLSRYSIGARHASGDLSIQGYNPAVIDGVLGLDILRTYNVVMDTSRKVLYVNIDRSRRGGLLGDHMGTYGFKRVRLALRHGNLEAPCSLEGKPGELIVDTGAWITTLDYNYVRSAHVSVVPTKLPARGYMIGGSGQSAVFLSKPDDFKVGDFQYPKGEIASQGHDRGVMGFLGPDLLEKAHAIIDFGNLSMFLK